MGISQADIDRTIFASSPVPANATYAGFFHGTVDSDRVLGEISLDVNFAGNALTGRGINFVHETQGSYSGTLTGVGNVDLNASTNIPQLTLVLRGTLQIGGADHLAAIGLDGNFYTYGVDTAGAIAGPAERNLRSSTIDNGVFAATK